ncbi:hypothetical protein CLIB1423_13S02168 [[Candida] railenensis]|uniref:Uncharacterized protein n=1 Tax=[Candida] railenensis TaxID=45579 RepID=A0A9P0QR15_9ASCO|nr:hypothetical protein CLIB1423_13S02168 [[Candida] railenensis]
MSDSSPSSSSSQNSSTEEDVDIMEIITGSPPKRNSSRYRRPVKRNKKDGGQQINPGSGDDEFDLSLPAIFQTEARKNEELSLRNKKIESELAEHDAQVRHEYSELVWEQERIIGQLNDNGSEGKVLFSLDKDRDYIEDIMTCKKNDSDGVKHYYFLVEERAAVDNGNGLFRDEPDEEYYVYDQFEYLHRRIIEEDIDFKEITDYVFDLKEVNKLERWVQFFKEIQSDSYECKGIEDIDFFSYMKSFGGCSDHLRYEFKEHLPKKYIHFYRDSEIALNKFAIMYYGELKTSSSTYWGDLRPFILMFSDFYLNKNYSDKLVETMVPVFALMLKKKESKFISEFLKELRYMTLEQQYNILYKLQTNGETQGDAYHEAVSSMSLAFISDDKGNILSEISPELELKLLEKLFNEIKASEFEAAGPPSQLKYDKPFYQFKLLNIFNFGPTSDINLLHHIDRALQDTKDYLHRRLGVLSESKSEPKEDLAYLTQMYSIVEIMSLGLEKKLIWNQQRSDLFYSEE